MNAERSVRENGKARVIFCLCLVAALVCGMFAVNSFAAGTNPANVDVKVDSCSTHSAAVTDGALYMWGTNDNGQFPESSSTYSVEAIKTAESVADVSVADNRTLVLYENGDLYAYGLDPLTQKSGLADKIASNVKQMSCSDTFAVYVTKSGALMAWGFNDCGQLGNGTTNSSLNPVRILDSGISKAVTGQDFTLALRDDGTVCGWGSNAYLQLGQTGEDGTVPVSFLSPVEIMEDVADIDAGDEYSCFLKQNGSLYTCGMNLSSETGVVSADSSTPLTKILSQVRSVSAGSTHGFAISENGTIYSWGYGLSGQQGNGTQQRVIGATATDLDFVQVYAGDSTSFGVDADGSVWSWGANTNRVLCTASGVDALEPVKVLNADMTWADDGSELQDVPAEPEYGASDGVTDEPIVVQTPFISGYADGTFKPDNEITRAEFLTMVAVALTDYDKDTDYGTPTFTDVGEHWYTNVIAYSQDKGLIHGYEDQTCRPNDYITRAEAAKITASALDLSSNATVSSFTDVQEGWAISAIEALAEKGILTGDGDGTFRPNDPITRAEAARVVGAYSFSSRDEAVQAQIAAITESPFSDVPTGKWYYPFILFAAGKLS